MEKQAIKELMYGGINEMMQNRRYYHHSTIGKEYSRWTEEGKAALTHFVNDITHYIYDAEQVALDNRAKDIMLKELKS
jgi:hypothetical protein